MFNLLMADHGPSSHTPLEDEPGTSAIIKAFWVDQLCINQADTAEKTAQVRKMHDIYYCATRTLFYLGDSDGGTALAVQTAKSLAQLKDKRTDEIPWQPDRGQDSDLGPVPDWPRLGVDDSGSDPFTTFATNLLGRKWFRRTWILQELVVTTVPVAVCGSTFIRWPWLVDACRVANREGLSANYRAHSTMNTIPRLENIRQHYITFRRILREQSTANEHVEKFLLSMLRRSLLPSSFDRDAAGH